MTWTLDNGTIVMQNFAKDEVKDISVLNSVELCVKDCSADKLRYWGGEYLKLVWNMTGEAECCYSDGCNDNREEKPSTTTTTTTTTSTSTSTSTTTSTTTVTVDCRNCPSVEWSLCNSLLRNKNIPPHPILTKSSGCSCLPGFLPIFDEHGLSRCLDPIVKTSSVYAR